MSDRHGDASPAEDVRDMDPSPSLSPSPSPVDLSPSQAGDGDALRADGGPDGVTQGCGQLETRWVLWHQFMKEHAHLDAWLRLAEQAVSSPNHAHVTFTVAKEELRLFERLRCEAGSHLVQLDSLTQRTRTLTRFFHGAMRTRLLALARECGRRWDEVTSRLESVAARLKCFVSEWEEFEEEREELAMWLADLDVRLTEVDHLNGNTCEKLRCLQSFQQCVCENSGRVNALLRRGEVLIQRSEHADAQRVENRLLELLRYCSQVYNNIARTHTRLLSMRLVFEDDWILSQAADSGCPSETLLEDEGALDKPNLDLPAVANHLTDSSQSVHSPTRASPSPIHHPPPPPSRSSPTHEPLGLEWDPSVDIGRPVSCDDADSSYFSISTGVKRWSYRSSLGCQSDVSYDIINQRSDVPSGREDHTCPSVAQEEAPWLNGNCWSTSTPERRDREPIVFDGRRVRAWLGVQSPAPSERGTSCSKAVQTDEDVKAEDESSCCDEDTLGFLKQSGTCRTSSTSSTISTISPGLLYLLPAAALLILACLIWVVLESPCHRNGFHLTLRYVNGPPPT